MFVVPCDLRRNEPNTRSPEYHESLFSRLKVFERDSAKTIIQAPLGGSNKWFIFQGTRGSFLEFYQRNSSDRKIEQTSAENSCGLITLLERGIWTCTGHILFHQFTDSNCARKLNGEIALSLSCVKIKKLSSTMIHVVACTICSSKNHKAENSLTRNRSVT